MIKVGRRGGEPSQLEQEPVAVVNRLAVSPVLAEELENELGLDRGDVPRVIEVGKASDLVQGVPLIDGEVRSAHVQRSFSRVTASLDKGYQ